MSGWIKRGWFTGGLVAVLMMVMMLMTTAVRAEEIRIAGEFLSTDFILKPLKEPFERAAGIKLSVRMLLIPPAFQELMNQTLDVFANSLPDEEAFQVLKGKGGEVDKTTFQSAIIARTPVSVVVAKGNPVDKLSREELKAIFTGRIQNWKDVGGENKVIRVIRPWGTPINSTLRYQIMDGKDYTPDMIRSLSWKDSRRIVAEIPDSISVLPTVLVDRSVKVLESPAIVQLTTFITKGEPSPAVRKLIDYARGEGQKFIKSDTNIEYR